MSYICLINVYTYLKKMNRCFQIQFCTNSTSRSTEKQNHLISVLNFTDIKMEITIGKHYDKSKYPGKVHIQADT